MIGSESGTVRLCEHEKQWETEARNTIARLKNILGDAIKDIQHVGSTAIFNIKAKPIIDIAIAVDNFDDVLRREKRLEASGFYYRPDRQAQLPGQLLFACGSYYEGTGNMQTHFIHIVLSGSRDWINYINFRDHLNSTPSAAKEYEKLKISLAGRFRDDGNRDNYIKGKSDFIAHTLRKALVKSYLGKTVNIVIDRPLGSVHPTHDDIIYPVNYGFIPNAFGGDGEEQDVYLMGVETPVSEFTGKIIAIVHRHNDVEDKQVMAPEGMNYTAEEIADAVNFQERYYNSEIEIIG